ncbi:MAG: hypothetical protein A3D31_10015 [Candidatus Fluviicola riflensis]|nr:MAG: hypothetical protein A3D31_10015 [Candidatus Fluviicola riflensis]OGS84383.1 MAG: hypothetical protein A3E30_11410 [Fluviicola sp. RIFCSPHIGHO2_12_FULL_43_24]
MRFPGFVGEWEVKQLGDDSNILMCKRIFAEQTNESEGIPFYKIGTLGKEPDAFISKSLFDEYINKYNFPKIGEILITCSGTVGKCIVFDGNDAYYQDSNIVWIDNPTLKTQNEFLYYVLSNINWGKLNSTTITRIYGSDLRNLKIDYPQEYIEQQKISSFLSLIDERISTHSKIIEALKTSIKATCQTVFNDDKEQFTKTPLDSVCCVKKGEQINSSELSKSGSYAVMNGGTTPSGYHSNFNADAGTISISEGGNSCGYVQYNHSKFWSGGHCYTLTKPNSTILNKYLYYFLKFNEQHIMSLRIGTGLPNIQKKDLEKFVIRLPNNEDQLEIVRILDLLTDKLEMEKSFLVLLTKQKQYLLKNLFI